MGVQIKDAGRPFAVKLKSLRKDYDNGAGLTQAELATRAGVAVQTVYLLEQGRRHNPSLTTATKLAKALGVSLDEIMT